jgi:hypothetical protein
VSHHIWYTSVTPHMTHQCQTIYDAPVSDHIWHTSVTPPMTHKCHTTYDAPVSHHIWHTSVTPHVTHQCHTTYDTPVSHHTWHTSVTPHMTHNVFSQSAAQNIPTPCLIHGTSFDFLSLFSFAGSSSGFIILSALVKATLCFPVEFWLILLN